MLWWLHNWLDIRFYNQIQNQVQVQVQSYLIISYFMRINDENMKKFWLNQILWFHSIPMVSIEGVRLLIKSNFVIS